MSKILVIDDERPTLSMFQLFLGAYGYEVLIAENGRKGLEIFKRERPRIVLTDIKMPGMDGLEVLKRIKEIDPLVEVVVITGHGDMEIAIQALNLNATDFINKPIQKDALDSALRRARERLRLAQSKEEKVMSKILDDMTLVEVRGNVTARSGSLLKAEYERALKFKSGKIIIHFDENSSISGDGIAVLTQLFSQSEEEGRAVAITGLSKNFRKVFSMVGITKFVKIYDSRQEAVAGLEHRN